MPSLDSIVKGAAAPDEDLKATAANTGTSPVVPDAGKQGDPTNNAPNSPSMIYLNLLILEASLRAQFLELRARRRHHTFFFTLLAAWIAWWGYQLFYAPREDGVGVGGSIYWAVEGAQKVCFMGGIITAILVWAVGIWERGIRWPRRWFAISNRGLRGFNCKLVVVRRPLWAELLSTVGFFLTYGLFSHTASSSYRPVEPSLLREVEKELQLAAGTHPTLVLPHEDEERGGGAHEEDLAPGGDYVKLLLLAKPFSSTFRENWELYRTEYWEKENERRALLRKKVKEHDRRLAKQQLGWFWWLPWRRVQPQHAGSGPGHSHGKPHHRPHTHPHADKERKRRSSSVRPRSASTSRGQAAPGLEALPDEALLSRKGSSSSTSAAGARRKKNASISRPKRPTSDSRSVTPEYPTSPLAKGSTPAPTSAPEETGGRVLRSAGSRSRVSSASLDK